MGSNDKMNKEELTEKIKCTLKSNDGFLSLLHISVYNSPPKAIANLSMLSSAEGLFMKRGE